MFLENLQLFRWFRRLQKAILLAGQVIVHILRGKLFYRNTLEQMAMAGPASLLITLVTGFFVGAVFTIQVAREFLQFGQGGLVGGVLSLALVRELAPVLTGVVLAGRVGSAFAAELGTMRVTEQIDALLMLRTDPVDYLVLPRVIACLVMTPILTILFACIGTFGGFLIAVNIYDIAPNRFLDSVRGFIEVRDLINTMIKAGIFGGLVAVIGCSWGLTTDGGAKGVGESTTAAVVTALLSIFVFNFFLSGLMFQGAGSALEGGL